MKRGGPIQRRTPLKRSGRLSPRRTRPRTIKEGRQVDPARLKAVRALACLACRKEGIAQDSPTEAHHIKRKADGSLYGAGQKAHDSETIPLCSGRHHWNGVHCQSKLSHREFEARYGNERDLLAETDAELAALHVPTGDATARDLRAPRKARPAS